MYDGAEALQHRINLGMVPRAERVPLMAVAPFRPASTARGILYEKQMQGGKKA